MTSPSDWPRLALAAAKTVAILKQEVRRLSSRDERSVVHRSLAEAQRRDERNKRRLELSQMRRQELERYSQQLELEIAQRTRCIQLILRHVSTGFLLIDQHLKLQDGFSQACNSLLGRKLRVGDELPKLLDLKTNDEIEQLTAAVGQVFADVLPEELSLHQLPRRFPVNDLVVGLEPRVVRDVDGRIEGLLFTLSDHTALEATQALSRNRDVLIGILRQRTAFQEFVAYTQLSLFEARDNINQIQLHRLIHTIKGNAGAWGLDEVVAAVHSVESQLIVDAHALRSISDALCSFLRANAVVLDLPTASCDGSSFDSGVAPDTAPAGSVRSCPAADLVGPIDRFALKVADRLGKAVNVKVEGMHLSVDVHQMRPVLRTLPHLIQNAIDHGIEAPDERLSKPACGTLHIGLFEHPQHWVLMVEDDGRGVAVQELEKRAKKLNLPADAGDSIRAGLNLVFLDGLSTADTATEISGRGVGMAAVREVVAAQGGSIELESSNQGTRIKIIIPKRPPTVSPNRPLEAPGSITESQAAKR